MNLTFDWLPPPLGLVTDSIALPINAKDTPAEAIMMPGGRIHHQSPLAAAEAVFASWRMLPHVGMEGSPNPIKLNVASANIAAGYC